MDQGNLIESLGVENIILKYLDQTLADYSLLGQIHGNPLQYSCLVNPMDRGSLAGYSPWGCERVATLATNQQQQVD